MLDRLLPKHILAYLSNINNITELRVRANNNLIYYNTYGIATVSRYIVTTNDIDNILLTASNNSLYSVNDMLNKGFLIYDNGIRIGVIGEGVIEDDKLLGMKNIRYLTIRIPKEINIDISKLSLRKKPQNTLIISPPGAGKTTLLRAITKHYSDLGRNVLLIDERYELAAVKNGKPALKVGCNTDVLSGVSKSIAYEIAIRTMRPDIISTDELYESIEANALLEAAYCGIKVFVTAHAKNLKEFKLRKQVSKIIDITEQVITLTDYPSVGTIENIEVI